MKKDKNLINSHTKVFIAGHEGLVGSAIHKTLSSRFNCQIVVASKSELDLRNQNKVNNFLKESDINYIVIAAAKVGGIHANSSYPADFIYDNLMIQSNLIQSAFSNDIKRILFLGSSCIYPKDINDPIKEEDLLSSKLEKTNEPYAVAKIAGLKMCESFNKQHNTFYRSVMPTNLYGEGDNFDEVNGHVIPSLIRRFHLAKKNKQKNVKVWGSGNPLREFMYVDDMADACVFLMNLSDDKYFSVLGNDVSHVNIGTGDEVSIKNLSLKVSKTVGYQGNISFDESMPDGTKRKLLDNSRILSLGWKPKISLENGLKKTYDWFKKNYDQ